MKALAEPSSNNEGYEHVYVHTTRTYMLILFSRHMQCQLRMHMSNISSACADMHF
jgi:hypothetical protein